MRRIAIIINSLTGGGAEKVMLTLSEHFIALGHQVVLFSLKPTKTYQPPEGLTVVYPFAHRNKSLRSWFNLQELSTSFRTQYKAIEDRDGAFDLTLVNLQESYRVASTCDLSNPYYVVHNSFNQELKREMFMGPSKYFYLKNIIKRLDGKHLLAVSQGVAKELRESTLFTPASVKCIYNPFNVQDIHKLSFDEPDDFGQVGSTKFILHIGRAAKAKRHDVLFKALQKVNPEYKLVCLSRNAKKLKKLAKKYGVSERVITPGFSDNPYSWMSRADLVVLSSDHEGLSLVLIEALLCGTPVVSTNCPHGPSEILVEHLAQYLVPVGQSDLLAGAINSALEDLPIAPTSPILEKISVDKVAQQYLALCH